MSNEKINRDPFAFDVVGPQPERIRENSEEERQEEE